VPYVGLPQQPSAVGPEKERPDGLEERLTGRTARVGVSGRARSPTSPLSVSFDGLDGDDVFWGTSGDDLFNGGPGDDHSWGMFNGDDTCISVETIDGDDCEHIS
jgi:hypothetical protein